MFIGIGPALHVHRHRMPRCWGPFNSGHTFSGEYRHVANEATSSNTGSTGFCWKDSGLWYWEVVPSLDSGSPFNCAVGIRDQTNTPENTTTGASMGVRSTNQILAGSSGASTGTGASYSSGDVIGLAVDFAAKKFWLAVNNTWMNSGDPAAGTGALFSAWSSGSYWAPWCWTDNSAGAHRFTWRVPSMFSYSPPTGFTRGWLD